jgi:DNA-binding NtrC family response regulator
VNDTSQRDQIILIDDDSMVIEGLALNLEHYYQVQCFSSAKEALEKMNLENPPQVIISDLKMPDLDGLQFIEQLRKKNKLSKVILSSGYAKKQDALRAIELGIFAFLEKPFTIDKLNSVVAQAAENFHLDIKNQNLLNVSKGLAHVYSQLSDEYFERIVLVENIAHEKDVKLLTDNTAIARYQEGLKRERMLLKAIEHLKRKVA